MPILAAAFLFLVLLPHPAQAQRARCGTPEPMPIPGDEAVSPPSDCGYSTNTPPPAPLALITPGSTWHFSCWFRDNPAGGALFNFADGYTITFEP